MKNLENTKSKLTLIFSLIILILFLLIGNSFFTFKFFQDKKNITNTYKKIQKIIFTQKNDIESFLENHKDNVYINKKEKNEIEKILSFTSKIFNNPELNFSNIEKEKNVDDVLIKQKSDFPFFNEKLIILNKKDIFYSNIEDFENINFKKYEDLKNWLYFEKKLAIIKENIWKKILLVFIKRNYNLSNLLIDISYLFLWIFIFSLIFYFIAKFFIKKIFKPVEENIDEMNNFIDNAWHELKTPLAAIKSSIWLLKETKTFDEELIKEAIEQTNKSNEIIWALRSLTKISKNTENSKFFIKEVIKEVLISKKEDLKNKNIKLNFDTKNKDIEIRANKNYFFIFVSNIISNAIKYNKDNWIITIKIFENFLEISDTGIWIPKWETNKIFERFYRTKNHRKIEWFGLWLAMVEKIAKIYNWKIEVESLEWVWTKFKIKF